MPEKHTRAHSVPRVKTTLRQYPTKQLAAAEEEKLAAPQNAKRAFPSINKLRDQPWTLQNAWLCVKIQRKVAPTPPTRFREL